MKRKDDLQLWSANLVFAFIGIRQAQMFGCACSTLWECKSPQLEESDGKLDLGEFQSLDADSLPSAVYRSPVETPPKSKNGYFTFVQFRVRQAQIFGCACLKRKCTTYNVRWEWITIGHQWRIFGSKETLRLYIYTISQQSMINHLGHEKFFSGNDAFSRRTLQQNLYIRFNKKKIMQYKQTGLHYYITNTEQQQKYLRI